MKYICTLEKEVNTEFVNEMSKLFNLDKHLVHLLYTRGVDTKTKLQKFLSPSISDLYDPFLFEDMAKVVEKIEHHIAHNSKILIFGDYDVDGVTATAILLKYFNSVGANVTSFMPNRYEDGYGLSVPTLTKILETNKPDLVITVDCGITQLKKLSF